MQGADINRVKYSRSGMIGVNNRTKQRNHAISNFYRFEGEIMYLIFIIDHGSTIFIIRSELRVLNPLYINFSSEKCRHIRLYN
jgi:hypothetical protein